MDGRAKVVLDLVEADLLLVLDVALEVLTLSVGAGLVADNEVEHGVSLE